jgi:polyisoprenyl-phosphate glycosyltransferase|tara:strand:- start:4612 stop:5469 length:858 start_codon:yes stop_codon:yes gene_type:complete
MKLKFVVLTPVYNDWKNLNKLLIKINNIFFNKIKQKFDLIVVDDFSTEKNILKKSKFKSIKNIKILQNCENLGSQRSIALGVKYIKKFYSSNCQIIVIDSDGQDNPTGILKLIDKNKKTNTSVVAKRGQRKESLWFKIFYEIYCILTFVLTLKTVRFGNYSLLKFNDLNKILTDGNLWNAFPATLSLSLPKVSSVTIDREKRYSGKSKINFFGLIFHALRVFSVLRFKILYSSIIYLGIIYLFLKDYFFLLIIFLFFFIFINISNFTLSLFNNKNLKDNFNNIKS